MDRQRKKQPATWPHLPTFPPPSDIHKYRLIQKHFYLHNLSVVFNVILFF